jgi:2,3-dihydroxybenzoate decarboxylase
MGEESYAMTEKLMKPQPGGSSGYLRIATEEAFAPTELLDLFRAMIRDGSTDDPGFKSLWGFYGGEASRTTGVFERMSDLGQRRIQDMDDSGIDKQIVSLTAPGVQILKRDAAVAMATLANDKLGDAVRSHPDRFVGLTAVAPQDPAAAAREIERGANVLGFKGIIINSHTQNEYLDDKKFWPIFEAAEALNMPVYIHPTTPSRELIKPLLESGLEGAIYGFAVETGMHVLRLIVHGIFDRFPKLTVVIGHCGEALPFWLPRIDFMHNRASLAGRYASWPKLQKKPSDYLRENIYVTTSGMAWQPAILFCQQVLGIDRVLYAMDYPYQFVVEEVIETDNLPISLADKKKLFQTNAERIFHL